MNGNFLNLNINIDNIDNMILNQSIDWCIPIKITIDEKNKERFIDFKDFYNFLLQLAMPNEKINNPVFHMYYHLTYSGILTN